jgi:O-antigen/teichoic acid export membrane protein
MVQPRPEPGDQLASAPIAVAEKKRLIRDGLINYSGVLATGLVGIAVVPMMLDRLGAQSYGMWVAVVAAVVVIGEFDFGLSAIVTREVAAAPQSEHARTARLLASAASAYLFLAVTGGLILGSIGSALDVEAAFVFAMGGVLSFAGRLIAFCIALLYGLRRFALANAIVAVGAVVTGAGTIAVLIDGGGLEAVAGWQAAAATMVAAGALVLVAPLWLTGTFGWRRPSWAGLRPHVRFGLSSQLVTVSVNLLSAGAPVVIGLTSGSRPVASYDVGRKFPLALSTISWRSSEAFFPTASREGRTGSLERRRTVLDSVTRWNLWLILPFSVVLLVLAPNLLNVWLDTPPAHATVVLRLLAVAVFVDAFGVGALHVLWAEGRMTSLLIVLAATTIAGLASMAALLWQVGVVGAAIAVVCATGLRSLLLLRVVTRAQQVRLRTLLTSVLRGLAVPVAGCAGSALLLCEAIDPHGWFGVASVGVIAFVAYLVAFSFGGARPEERALLDAVTRRVRGSL